MTKRAFILFFVLYNTTRMNILDIGTCIPLVTTVTISREPSLAVRWLTAGTKSHTRTHTFPKIASRPQRAPEGT